MLLGIESFTISTSFYLLFSLYSQEALYKREAHNTVRKERERPVFLSHEADQLLKGGDEGDGVSVQVSLL